MTLLIIVTIVAIVLSLNAVYSINEQEEAVLSTFGVAKSVTESGLHFKIPFVQKVTKVNTTIQGFGIGYDELTNEETERESLMITSDFNFVNVDFFIEYRIVDPVKAVFASEDPVMILKNISQSCIRSVIGSYDVDSVLTTGKNEIQALIKEWIVSKLGAHDIGIQLVNITIQDSEPPTAEVMEAFKAVETAKQGKETALNNANKYRNEKIPEAQAEVDRILKEAEAQKQERINVANGQVARFRSIYEEYVKNPVVTRERMFYETMEEILPAMKVVIDGGGDNIQTMLPLDSFTGDNSGETGTVANGAQTSAAGTLE
jgi:membrane protease subunit HflK